MSLVEFLSQPIFRQFGLTLLHFLWQGLAVGVLAAVLVWVFRIKHGNGRYAAYLIAFFAMVICPMVTFTMIDIPDVSQVDVVKEMPTRKETVMKSYMPLPAVEAASVPEVAQIAPVADNTVILPPVTSFTGPAEQAPVPFTERLSAMLDVSMPWVLVAWMVGVVVLSVRLLAGFIGIYRWRRNLLPLDDDLSGRLASLSERLGMGGFSRVFISPKVCQAMAVGYIKPVVLLPAAMLTQMPVDMVEAVIAHELAHIRRFDLWVNLLQRLVETLLFYHPAVWWLSNKIRTERELCCDAMAVKVTGQRLTYAKTLQKVTGDRVKRTKSLLAAGLGKDTKPTLSRVRHILGLKPHKQNSPSWQAGLIAVLLLAAIAIPTTVALTKQSVETPDLHEEVVDSEGFVFRTVSFPMQRYFNLDKDTGYENFAKQELSAKVIKDSGFDLFIRVSDGVQMIAANMKIVALKDNELGLSAEQVWSRVNPVTPIPEKQLERGRVYAFQTDKKRVGILSVSGFISTEPPTVSFRYKAFSLRFREVAEEEELKHSSLPNGQVVLAIDDSQAGNVFSFLQGRGRLRKDSSEPAMASYRTAYHRGIADLILNDSEDMQFSITSGKVKLLGEGTLGELTNESLDADLESGGQVPVKLGWRYLVKTNQGKFGLFRVLAVARRAIMIQWIYQPDGSTSFSGLGGLLDNKLYYSGDDVLSFYTGTSTPRVTTVLQKLRELGVRVCIEYGKDDYNTKIKRLSGDGTSRQGTVRSVLDEFVKKTGRHKWELVKGTNIISICKSKNSLLDWTPNWKKLKTPIKNRSWISILKEMDLAGHDIQFPHWAGLKVIRGRMIRTPPDKLISIDVDRKDTARTVLAKICREYGDGMYFTLRSTKNGRNELVFETNPSLHELSLLEEIGELKEADLLNSIEPRDLNPSGESLLNVLRAYNVESDGLNVSSIHEDVQGFGVLDNDDMFTIAYYSNQEKPASKVYVKSLNKKQSKWTQHAFDIEKINEKVHFIPNQISSIKYAGGYYYLNIHGNPSFGYLVVLTKDLNFKTVLKGWTKNLFDDGTLVYQNSQVHFAPTHSAEISVYNPNTNIDRKIYPSKPYSKIRAEHIAKVRAAYEERGDNWFRIRNHHGDPELFNNHVTGKVTVDNEKRSVSFVIAYENKDYGSKGYTEVLHVYENIDAEEMKVSETIIPADSNLDIDIEQNNNWLTNAQPDGFGLVFTVTNKSNTKVVSGISDSSLYINGTKVKNWTDILADRLRKAQRTNDIDAGKTIKFHYWVDQNVFRYDNSKKPIEVEIEWHVSNQVKKTKAVISKSRMLPLGYDKVDEMFELIRRSEKIDLKLVYQALIGPQTTLRAEAATYLGDYGDKSSIPYLIDALADESMHVGAHYIKPGMATTRYRANESLKKLSGKDFGFAWDDPQEKRFKEIEKWQNWWRESEKELNAESVMTDGFGPVVNLKLDLLKEGGRSVFVDLDKDAAVRAPSGLAGGDPNKLKQWAVANNLPFEFRYTMEGFEIAAHETQMGTSARFPADKQTIAEWPEGVDFTGRLKVDEMRFYTIKSKELTQSLHDSAWGMMRFNMGNKQENEKRMRGFRNQKISFDESMLPAIIQFRAPASRDGIMHIQSYDRQTGKLKLRWKTVDRGGKKKLKPKETSNSLNIVLEILDRPEFLKLRPKSQKISLDDYTNLKLKYIAKNKRWKTGYAITYRVKDGDDWRNYSLELESFDNDSIWVAELVQKGKGWHWIARYQLDRTARADKEFEIAAILKERSKVIGGVKYGMTIKELFARKGRHYKFEEFSEGGSGRLIFDDVVVDVRGWMGDAGRVVIVTPLTKEVQGHYKDLPYEDEPKAADDSNTDWGKTVEGVQMRVRSLQQKLSEGDLPKFKMDVRNNGKADWDLVLAPEHWQLEVDGMWYTAGTVFSGEVSRLRLPPGKVQKDIEFSPNESWKWNNNGRALKITSGKHKIRLAFTLFGPSTKDFINRRFIQVTSNPVEIEVLPEKNNKIVTVNTEDTEGDISKNSAAIFVKDYEDFMAYRQKLRDEIKEKNLKTDEAVIKYFDDLIYDKTPHLRLLELKLYRLGQYQAISFDPDHHRFVVGEYKKIAAQASDRPGITYYCYERIGYHLYHAIHDPKAAYEHYKSYESHPAFASNDLQSDYRRMRLYTRIAESAFACRDGKQDEIEKYSRLVMDYPYLGMKDRQMYRKFYDLFRRAAKMYVWTFRNDLERLLSVDVYPSHSELREEKFEYVKELKKMRKNMDTMSLTFLPNSPVRSLADLTCFWTSNTLPKDGLPDIHAFCDIEIRRASDQKRIARIDCDTDFGIGGPADHAVRRIGKLPDGQYLMAMYYGDRRCSNVASVTLNSDYDPSKSATLTLMPFAGSPANKSLSVALRAIGPNPKDDKLTGLSIWFPKIIVEGIERKPIYLPDVKPKPLEPSKTYLSILSLDRFTPAVKPAKKHTVKAVIGKYESAPIVISLDNSLNEKWDAATPKLERITVPRSSLKGKVINRDGKKGAGYRVSVFEPGGWKDVEITGDDGLFDFPDVPPGEYHIYCEHKETSGHNFINTKVKIEKGKALQIELNHKSNFVMFGSVTDNDGKPVSEVYIQLTCQDSHGQIQSTSSTAYALKNGRYELHSPFETIKSLKVNNVEVDIRGQKLKPRSQANFVIKKNANGPDSIYHKSGIFSVGNWPTYRPKFPPSDKTFSNMTPQQLIPYVLGDKVIDPKNDVYNGRDGQRLACAWFVWKTKDQTEIRQNLADAILLRLFCVKSQHDNHHLAQFLGVLEMPDHLTALIKSTGLVCCYGGALIDGLAECGTPDYAPVLISLLGTLNETVRGAVNPALEKLTGEKIVHDKKLLLDTKKQKEMWTKWWDKTYPGKKLAPPSDKYLKLLADERIQALRRLRKALSAVYKYREKSEKENPKKQSPPYLPEKRPDLIGIELRTGEKITEKDLKGIYYNRQPEDKDYVLYDHPLLIDTSLLKNYNLFAVAYIEGRIDLLKPEDFVLLGISESLMPSYIYPDVAKETIRYVWVDGNKKQVNWQMRVVTPQLPPQRYPAQWLLKKGDKAKEEYIPSVTSAMSTVEYIKASPEGRYLAVGSVGEGHRLLEVIDLRSLLQGKKYKRLQEVGHYPGFVRWDNGKAIFISCALQTRLNKDGNPEHPSLEVMPTQTYSLTIETGEIEALSEGAKDPVGCFIKELSSKDDGSRANAANALEYLKAVQAIDALKKAYDKETHKDVKADFKKAIDALEKIEMTSTLNPDLIGKRNKLLADAQAEIQASLIKLSKRFPQLKKAANWQQQTTNALGSGPIDIALAYPKFMKSKPKPSPDNYVMFVAVLPPSKTIGRTGGAWDPYC